VFIYVVLTEDGNYMLDHRWKLLNV